MDESSVARKRFAAPDTRGEKKQPHNDLRESIRLGGFPPGTELDESIEALKLFLRRSIPFEAFGTAILISVDERR
jgi:hypothetical protein